MTRFRSQSILDVSPRSERQRRITLEVLRWVYCANAGVTKDNVEAVLSLAGRYRLQDLEDQCGRPTRALTGLLSEETSAGTVLEAT